MTIKKNEKGQTNLGINSYGKLNSQTGLYEITLDVSKGMDHINGDYEMTIHAADFRAEAKQVWALGTIPIWFKEGSDDATNEGIKEEYKPMQIIEHYFRPEAPEKSILVSLRV